MCVDLVKDCSDPGLYPLAQGNEKDPGNRSVASAGLGPSLTNGSTPVR